MAGESALTIARQEGFYAIERFLSLAMARKSQGWAVSRATFTTHMQAGEPGDCREAAFEDEARLYFFTELSGMDGRRIAHEYLIGKGTVLKLTSSMGKDLVSQAIVDGNIGLVGWLIERGLDIEAYVNGAETPLLLAVKNGESAMALYLMTRGADVRFKRNRDGQSALQLSVSAGNVELTAILLERGANPNAANDRGYTPLHSAMSRCDLRTASALIAHGADPDRKNDRGETPRDSVVECDRQESWDSSVLVSDTRS